MGQMATLTFVSENLGGRIVWASPTHGRCGSGQILWEEVRLVASVVNIRVLDGAEIPPFIYSDKGGKRGFPKVRVFDESGGEIKNIPTRSWDSLDYDEADAGSERVALSFAPREEGNESALDPSAPPPYNPESPSVEFDSRSEEPYRVYFARGTNLIVLKEGRLEDEEESCVLVNAANKFLCHGAGVAGAIRERAGPKFQEESYRMVQRRKNPIKTGDVILRKVAGPNGKPVLHAIGHERGQRTDMLTLDGIIDKICLLARDNNYKVVAMPIISGGIFGFNNVDMGASLVHTLRRKTDHVEWPRMWIVCHPDAAVLRAITARVNKDQAAGEGRSDQGDAVRQEPLAAWSRAVEEEALPDYPILK